MSLVALADDKARGNIEGSEQRRCPVPYVIVRPTFGDARHHRQVRLFAVQGLDLAFLVDAENKRPVGWREVKADDDSPRDDHCLRHPEADLNDKLVALIVRPAPEAFRSQRKTIPSGLSTTS